MIGEQNQVRIQRGHLIFGGDSYRSTYAGNFPKMKVHLMVEQVRSPSVFDRSGTGLVETLELGFQLD